MVVKSKSRTVYWLENKLYLNITNKCSNRCIFCIRNFKTGVADFNLKLNEEPSISLILHELKQVLFLKNWKEIVFCGFGEPTERLDCLLAVTKWIKKHYSRPVSIRLNTNGHGNVLNPRRNVVKELKAAGVEKVSVSLNADMEETYNEICKPQFAGAYDKVLEFIQNSKEELETEVTAVTTPEINLEEIRKIAKELGVNFKVRQCIPCLW